MYVTQSVAERAADDLCRLMPDAAPDCVRQVLAGCSSATTTAHARKHHGLVGISDKSAYGAQLMSHVQGGDGVIGPLQ